MGRPKQFSDDEIALRHLERVQQYQERVGVKARDIGEKFPWGKVDWNRRLRCKHDLKAFCETYLGSAFFLGWSRSQEIFLQQAEKTMSYGGKCAVAMPRGEGKSTTSRGTVIFGGMYGKTKYVTLIAANTSQAVKALRFIKTNLYNNERLRQDFPEIGYPIYKIENRGNKARGQTCYGRLTDIEWGSESVRFPVVTMPNEVAHWYMENDPESVKTITRESGDTLYMPAQAGVIINVVGITSNIRGQNETHPLTLEVLRPDYVILDDIQNDIGAKNQNTCDDMITLVDGAIEGLAGPKSDISGIMPCTVIYAGDVAETYLDHEKKPEWNGIRCKMVESWPAGITDHEITLETPAGQLWTKYADLRKESYRMHKDLRLATEFYGENREVMDDGFSVSWPERFNEKKYLSAFQSAFELRLKNRHTFLSEYQQIGALRAADVKPYITAETFAKKVMENVPQGCLPHDTEFVSAFIDMQEEVLFYTVVGFGRDFTAVVSEYGIFPAVDIKNYEKKDLLAWSLMTKAFLEDVGITPESCMTDPNGKTIARPDAKYYWGLEKLVAILKSKQYTRVDNFGTKLGISIIGIDATRGQNTATVRNFCRMNHSQNCGIYPQFGQYVRPSSLPMARMQRKPDIRFETDVNPNADDCRWYIKQTEPNLFEFHTDTSMMKDFLRARVETPKGTSGCLYLYHAPPHEHELFAAHVCESEYPEEESGKYGTKNHWIVRNSWQDNDFLDCLVGCMTMGSFRGATVRSTEQTPAMDGGRTIGELARKLKKNPRRTNHGY